MHEEHEKFIQGKALNFKVIFPIRQMSSCRLEFHLACMRCDQGPDSV